jgi:hypothetical protein
METPSLCVSQEKLADIRFHPTSQPTRIFVPLFLSFEFGLPLVLFHFELKAVRTALSKASSLNGLTK